MSGLTSLAMAPLLTGVIAEELRLSASLRTMSTRGCRILAITISVAQLLALMQATLQHLATRTATTGFLEMARLTVQLLFPTRTPLVHQEWALGAGNVIRVTVMTNGGMTTAGSSLAVKAALGWASATWLWWLQNRPATVAANLMEYGLRTASAGSSVAHLLTVVTTTFQWPSTRLDADVLRFDRHGLFRRSVLPL